MRSRKLKFIETRFDRYLDAIEERPAELAGRWAERHLPGAREVRLDLGCGKGAFTIRSAQAEPDVLFVGVDLERGCVAMAAKRALEAGVANAVFAVGAAANIASFFAPGELDLIYLNFSTPFTTSKQAPLRLTHAKHLDGYRDVLRPGGAVRFKTDSAPLFDYSLTQFELAGYRVEWLTRDLHAYNPAEVQTDYEEFLSAKGASIHALYATLGPRPATMEQTAPQGLVSYLPQDLDSLTYVPYGMESTVTNLKNRRRKLAEKAAAQQAAEQAEEARQDA